jgi:hypothetical protein
LQRLAAAPGDRLAPPEIFEGMAFVRFGERRQCEEVPGFLRQHVAREVVLVQPVHDEDDRPGVLVVEAAVEGVVEPFVGRLALRLRQRLLGFRRVVDDDDVGAAPGQHPADRGQEGFRMARRQVDDQPADLVLAHRRLPGRPALAGRSGDRRDELDAPP